MSDVRCQISKVLRTVFLTSVTCLLTSACGFQPMYGVNRDTQVGVETKLAQVEIGGIPDREGQYLRNAVIDRFYRDGRPVQPVYKLSVSPIYESRTNLDITKTADATRGQLRLEAFMILTDTRTNQKLLERKLRSITGFNMLGSEFATRVTEQDARENALNDLARQIEMQINLYFKRL
ncbi:MAG: hypothetical protein IT558_03755 [Alphaproteobacteria bacterium]|nr:hypothetical protein [Alphaproteobacteria bacterium]